ILTEMDGFERTDQTIVLGATNRPDVLDPALLRPGRFDRRVILDLPDVNDREEVLQIHARGKQLDPGVALREIAERTPGFSGADLENLVNEAAILAARRNKKSISMAEFAEAIDRVIAGPERKSRIISEREKSITAYHEAGHALVARHLKNTDPVHKISIVARGMMGGYTRLLPTEDRYFWTRSQFKDSLAVSLGGLTAEELVFNERTTGAESDIEHGTKIARKMVMEFGMSDKLGPRAFGRKEELIFLGRELSEQRNYSEKVAEEIDDEIHTLIEDAHHVARDILESNRAKLVQIADRLVQEETLEGEALNELFDSPIPSEELSGVSSS
ncbi:MAG: AAA family ATPase, partial [Dehalococcoidia bacterium]|nr:AAA family ATPase [Dehalococcoidia bacterium]